MLQTLQNPKKSYQLVENGHPTTPLRKFGLCVFSYLYSYGTGSHISQTISCFLSSLVC